MIFNQFQHNPMQNRFSGSRGWLAFIIGLAVMTLILVALPFLLLIGAVTFIALSIFGRVFLKRHLARFKQQTEKTFQQGDTQQTVFKDHATQSSAHTGRTFEHNPNE
ncbi:hypothetical protein [Shewanella youngdeokensis]|uniref:Uncharacterized protein n=1 Tax=Shewanella youngdeokensis TaxID=2999068 RepID=A0ABZ0JYR6_9GAMM|nr:hypothetical protein RGE70_01080 [Shewanella sp. DAU334]